MAVELFELVASLKELKELKGDYEEKLKGVNKSIRRLEEDIIPKHMDNQELTKAVFPNIGTIYLLPQVRSNVKVVNRDKVHGWFKENGHGDLIKETIPGPSMISWVKNRLENGEPIPEGIDVSLLTIARLRSK